MLLLLLLLPLPMLILRTWFLRSLLMLLPILRLQTSLTLLP
jgi:hypothetical protein